MCVRCVCEYVCVCVRVLVHACMCCLCVMCNIAFRLFFPLYKPMPHSQSFGFRFTDVLVV